MLIRKLVSYVNGFKIVKMVSTDIIGEQYLRNDDGSLAANDEDNKMV